MSDLKTRLTTQTAKVEARLDVLLTSASLENEVARPERLLAAMRHGALNGGKRIRPVLLLETVRLFDQDDTKALDIACALEFIHCYSLVHDDLPAMDDDDLRRGQPTVHIAYDEATAILAGDALLTLAFDIVANPGLHQDAHIQLRLVRELAQAAGLGGMAGGQMLDLESEHRDRSEAEIRKLQSMKTGALLRFACRGGAIFSNASNEDVERLTHFGEIIGLAFQLADDLLDVEASPEQLGKATGKDADAGKATLVGVLGIEQTKAELASLLEEAQTLLAPFGTNAVTLVALAEYIAKRDR